MGHTRHAHSASHRSFLAALLAAVLTVLLLAPSPAARSPRPTYGDAGGIAMGGPWTWLDPAVQARDLDEIAALGATWIRVSFPWSSMQWRADRYDWSVHDRIVLMAHERGLEVIANVAYTPWWAQPTDCVGIHCPPASPEAFAAFVQKAVDRYADYGVTAWEIWNEPNLTSYWLSGTSPENYARLLELSYAAAKTADPSVTVLSAGLSPRGSDGPGGLTPLTFLSRMFDALEGREAFDALAMHPYAYPRAPLDYHPTNTFTMLPRIHDLMTAHGAGHKQIWITEFGYWTSPLGAEQWEGSVTPELQAQYLVDAFEAAGARDWIGPMLWFSYRDRGEDAMADYRRDDNFGLVEQNGTAKPALKAFSRLMSTRLPR